jgi:hypothetical protein
MGTISTRSLAAYFLIFSLPIGYFLLPIGSSTAVFLYETKAEDPINFPVRIIVETLTTFGGLSFLFGLWVIHRGMKEGEKGYALTLLGLLLMVVATVASIGWQPDPKSWSFLYANQKVGFIFNTGLVLFSLGLSTREQHNTKLAYAVTLAAVFFGFGQVFFVLIFTNDSIVNVAGGLRSSWGAFGAFLLSPYGAYGAFQHFLYFVVAVWSITLGLKLRKTIQPSNASYSKVTPTDY